MHDGHRERQKNRLLNVGSKAFFDHELLEMLLFFSIPRINTNVIAHRLLDRFGSLAGVFAAGKEDLLSVEGIGENSLTLILLVKDVMHRTSQKPPKKRKKMNNLTNISAFVTELFENEKKEKIYLIALDNSSNIIDSVCISEDGASFSDTTTNKIIRSAISLNAASVILAHNHPDGIAIPSTRDLEMNQKIYAGLRMVEITLIDHFIVSGNKCNPMMHTK